MKKGLLKNNDYGAFNNVKIRYKKRLSTILAVVERQKRKRRDSF
jgi:hypothetical protein